MPPVEQLKAKRAGIGLRACDHDRWCVYDTAGKERRYRRLFQLGEERGLDSTASVTREA